MSGATVQGKRKTTVGRVVSDKMDKTIVVSVERLSRHRLYKRVVHLTTKFKAHDERNEARIGDTVRIEEARPMSATKRWRLIEIVQRASEGANEPIVAEEAETSEAIHMAAHPGRRDAAEAERAEAERAEAERAGAGTEAQETAEAGGQAAGGDEEATAAGEGSEVRG
jgi:small subunit ribosomal protein S17